MQKYFDLPPSPSLAWIDLRRAFSLAPDSNALAALLLFVTHPLALDGALVLYALSSVGVLVLAVSIWKSSNALSIRFSALILARSSDQSPSFRV